MMSNVIVRFAPSPTGYLHIGGARTALFNWLFAKHHKGQFLLRIEDTDRERSTPETVEAIFKSLKWLGLEHDGDVVFQFARAQRHAEIVHQLVREGKAYYCYCSPQELEQMREQARAQGLPPRYNGMWRDRDPAQAPEGVKPVVRFKAPQEGETIIEDMVQGTVTLKNNQLDDMVLLRADGTPTYMLSVVVDDYDMGITHIIRGDDHLTNAFRQYHLYQACGWKSPAFGHIPLIHGQDGAKLSKRHGALGTENYQEMGFLADAMVNYLARLGWSHGDEEIFSREQAIEWFDGGHIGRSAARFDMVKLTNLNAWYIRHRDDAQLIEDVKPFLEPLLKRPLNDHDTQLLLTGMPGLKERAKTLIELAESALFYCKAPTELPNLSDTEKQLAASTANRLEQLSEFTASAIEQALRQVAADHNIGLGALAKPLRVLLTGKTVSPSLFEIMEVLGKQESLARLKNY